MNNYENFMKKKDLNNFTKSYLGREIIKIRRKIELKYNILSENTYFYRC